MTTLAEFRPLPWQADALHAITHGLAPCYGWRGGVGSGKSLTICVALAALAQTWPGTQWVLGMDTHPRLEMVHLPLLLGLRMRADYNKASRLFEFENGSTLRLKHLEYSGDPMAAGSPLEGGNIDGIGLDECQVVDRRYFKVAQMRTRQPRRIRLRSGEIVQFPALTICSGLPIGDWWTPAVRRAGGMTWRPKTSDNIKHLDPTYVERLRATLTEREQRALMDGEEMPVEGQVLYAFSGRDYPEGNVLRGHAIDWRHTRTMLVVDLGYRSPAVLLFAEVWRGTWCVVREWAPERTTLPDLCEMLAADVCPRRDWTPGGPRLPVDELVVDPAGDAMNDQTGHPDLALLARPQPAGLGLYPIVETDRARRLIAPGCQRLNLALERRLLLISGRLYDAGQAAPDTHRTLIRAIQGYAWDPRNPAKPRKDGVHDHHIDALRYGHRRVLWEALPPSAVSDRMPRAMEVDTDDGDAGQAQDAR